MEHNIYIIAEAGTNHCGSHGIAKELVNVALSAGADSVKFQIIYPEGLYLPKCFKNGTYVENEVYLKRASAMLDDDVYRKLAEYCKTKGLGFSASVFDFRGIDLLDEIDVDYIKIASCDLNNSSLLIEAAERGRKLVISTGMASLGEIERAVSDVVKTGNTDVVLMHCVSIYPCPTARMNLSFLEVLRDTFGFPVGLSDHTENSLAASIAVSRNAVMLEKHFTLDRNADGFDHAYAMEPEGLKAFIDDIRACEEACELPRSKINAAEKVVKERARRGLHASRDIEANEIFEETDILIVRPEGPLAPNDVEKVLHKRAARKIYKYEPLSLDMVVLKKND